MTKREELLNMIASKGARRKDATQSRRKMRRFIERKATEHEGLASYLYDVSVMSRKQFIGRALTKAKDVREDLITTVIKTTAREIRNSLYRDDSGERSKILNETLDEYGLSVSTEAWTRLKELAENRAERLDDLLGGRYEGTKIEPA